MRRFVRWIGHEPVALQGAIQAAIGLAIAFQWVTWNVEQIGAVVGTLAAFLALLTRQAVTPFIQARSASRPPRMSADLVDH
jgi:hypothetical protein